MRRETPSSWEKISSSISSMSFSTPTSTGPILEQDVLEHRPQHCERSLREDLGMLLELRADDLVVDVIVAVDRHDVVGTDEEIDLGALDRLAVVEVARGLQDDEQQVVVALELAALVPFEAVADGERMQLQQIGEAPAALRDAAC